MLCVKTQHKSGPVKFFHLVLCWYASHASHSYTYIGKLMEVLKM